PSAAVKTIIGGSPRQLDIGSFSGRYFTYIAAFGAFTGVAYTTPQSAKRALGHFAYVLGGLAAVPAIKARHTIVEYGDGTIEGDFIFGCVANSTSVAGFVKLDPKQVDLSDGLFEVILVRQPIRAADFFDIISNILSKTYGGDNVIMLHASNVSFKFDEEVAWTVDGEDGGSHSSVEITNHREAIQIIVT
ncbi:MAG: diacylglycerol kinase family lipid kinase, partial [Oscillospiraceae bacterium]|nr:diacylglycerol kinase family lipid kinase [Oscillospiraceae bacterium]